MYSFAWNLLMNSFISVYLQQNILVDNKNQLFLYGWFRNFSIGGYFKIIICCISKFLSKMVFKRLKWSFKSISSFFYSLFLSISISEWSWWRWNNSCWRKQPQWRWCQWDSNTWKNYIRNKRISSNNFGSKRAGTCDQCGWIWRNHCWRGRGAGR